MLLLLSLEKMFKGCFEETKNLFFKQNKKNSVFFYFLRMKNFEKKTKEKRKNDKL